MRKEASCYYSTGQRAFVTRTGCILVVVATEFVPWSCPAHQIGSLRAVFVLLPCSNFSLTSLLFSLCFLHFIFAALGLVLRAPSLPDDSAAEILCSWSAGSAAFSCLPVRGAYHS
jgi:hypothetical protein